MTIESIIIQYKYFLVAAKNYLYDKKKINLFVPITFECFILDMWYLPF